MQERIGCPARMKRLLTADRVGRLLAGVFMGLIPSPWRLSPADRFRSAVIDTVSWGAAIPGFDEVVPALEDIRSDPGKTSRILQFMRENPPPGCTCPERDEWERRYCEAMGNR